MKKLFLALLFVATPVRAQLHYEAGLYNTGPLATEVTSRIRTFSLPGSMYLGLSIDGKLYKQLGLTGHVSLPFTMMQVQPCDPSPCQPQDRWNWRPARTQPLTEVPLWLFDIGLGLREKLGVVSVAGGVAAPIFNCPYAYCGATPMATKGLWAESRVEVGVAEKVTMGIVGGLTWIPPEGKGLTVASYASGFKEEGKPWPAPGYDPLHIVMLHVGISLSRE